MDWPRLGRLVHEERSRRWRRRADFARACGLSLRTIAALENTERTNFGPEVLAAVEAALGWEIGDATRVLNGLKPRRRMDERTTRLLDVWARLSPDAQRLVIEFAERAIDPD